MSIEKKMDVDSALLALPVRRAPGRPKKQRGPLSRDVGDDHYFSVKNLIRLFTKSPANCLHWSVLKEFEVEDNGVESTEYIPGKVSGWQENGGRYAWSVRFPDGEVEVMQCEDLAEAISFSHSLGLNITGLPN